MQVREGESKSDTIPLGSSVLFRCDVEISSLQTAGLVASLLGPSPAWSPAMQALTPQVSWTQFCSAKVGLDELSPSLSMALL